MKNHHCFEGPHDPITLEDGAWQEPFEALLLIPNAGKTPLALRLVTPTGMWRHGHIQPDEVVFLHVKQNGVPSSELVMLDVLDYFVDFTGETDGPEARVIQGK